MPLDLHILSLSLELIDRYGVIRTGRTCFLPDYHIQIRHMHTYSYTEFYTHTHTLHCFSSEDTAVLLFHISECRTKTKYILSQ